MLGIRSHGPANVPLKNAPFPWWGIWAPSNSRFLGPTDVIQPFLHSSPVCQTDRHTNHCDICSNGPHLCTACRRCGLTISFSLLHDHAQCEPRTSAFQTVSAINVTGNVIFYRIRYQFLVVVPNDNITI